MHSCKVDAVNLEFKRKNMGKMKICLMEIKSVEQLCELKLVARDVATNDSTDFIRRNKKLNYFELIFVQLGDSHCNIEFNRIDIKSSV